MRYEDLVAQPEEVLRRVADFLELPYAPEMAKFHEGRVRYKPGQSAKKAWLPATPGLRDWRSERSPREIELFEALAGDLLSDLGYESGATVISDEIVEVAERCRKWWQDTQAAQAVLNRHFRYQQTADT